jgi:hypothetical protein
MIGEAAEQIAAPFLTVVECFDLVYSLTSLFPPVLRFLLSSI